MSYVYFIQEVESQQPVISGPIKIGVAVNPEHRMGKLQIGNPRHLRLLGVLEPPQGMTVGRLEGALHRYFASHHVRGEWFSSAITGTVLELLARDSDALPPSLIAEVSTF